LHVRANMERLKLIEAREKRQWTQAEAAKKIGVDNITLYRWETGKATPRGYNLRQLCDVYELKPSDINEMRESSSSDTVDLNTALLVEDAAKISTLPLTFTSAGPMSKFDGLWADDLLAIYARGIAACQDLYCGGNPHQVEAILPLYCNQTTLLAQQPSPLQQSAADLASQAQLLACELLTDREDFGAAQQAGQKAFQYGQIAGDTNLQVAALINLANLGFHRKLSTAALQTYQHAISLLHENVTPLLQGRTYAGITEVYAMRGQLEEAMQAMGSAYEHYPLRPEDDPAYSYLRASRYSLYVFGDAQSRLFLGQPQEADQALITMQRENNDPAIEPITNLDMLYYQAEVQIQQGELEKSSMILLKASMLARNLGSRLYFNKLAVSYHQLQKQWSKEPVVIALEDAFRPW
jgi:transcriptional regulator with XRE-family HTH domain